METFGGNAQKPKTPTELSTGGFGDIFPLVNNLQNEVFLNLKKILTSEQKIAKTG